MLDLYAKGMGSASVEAEKSAKNITGRLNALKNTFNDTFNNIVNSDMVLAVVNGLNSILEITNKVTDALGTMGSITLGAGILGVFKSVGCLKMLVCPHHV